MTSGRDIFGLVATEADDAGCAGGFAVLHRYVEVVLLGGDAERDFPSVAAHLRSCPACRLDYLGLVEAASVFGDVGPSHSSDD
jgi:hypothetical protein